MGRGDVLLRGIKARYPIYRTFGCMPQEYVNIAVLAPIKLDISKTKRIVQNFSIFQESLKYFRPPS